MRLIDGLGEVVVAGEKIHRVDGAGSRMTDHIKTNPKVHALLLAIDTDPAQPQLHPRQEGNLLLSGRRFPITGSVIPVHTQQRQPAALLDQSDQVREQDRVVDTDTPTDRGAGHTSRRGRNQITGINIESGTGSHDPPRNKHGLEHQS
nr:hypothetical protein [Rathayibacter tanaceti]